MVIEQRLIDITPLIDDCDECMSIEWNHKVSVSWADAEEDFKQRLLDAPVVDAVEVVRCKDCICHEKCAIRGKVWCKKMCRYMAEDGYCSEGKNDD